MCSKNPCVFSSRRITYLTKGPDRGLPITTAHGVGRGVGAIAQGLLASAAELCQLLLHLLEFFHRSGVLVARLLHEVGRGVVDVLLI